MKPGRTMGIPVSHLAETGVKIYYVNYKEGVGVSGEKLQVEGVNSQLGRCVVLGTGEAERVLQKRPVYGVFISFAIYQLYFK